MSDIDPGNLFPLLTRESGLKFPLGNDILEIVKLPESQIQSVMVDLGRHLGVLHTVRGEGFGLIDPKNLGKGKLVGLHKSWYEFILENFSERFKQIEDVLREEKQSGVPKTKLSDKNRRLMSDLISKRNVVKEIIGERGGLIEAAASRFLNGNIHMGSIAVNDGLFVGLFDYHQSLLGDPVDDLAYFSVMPEGEKYLPDVLKGWKEKITDPKLEEKLHLYRLIESYRKIIRRYVKYQYLQDYPEPLVIAQQELAYYNKF